MSLILWHKTSTVGVLSINAQHSLLLGLLNELHDAMTRDESRTRTVPLLKRLVACTRDHFYEEESMMEADGYAGLDAHRDQHRELTRKLETYMIRLEAGHSTVHEHLVNFLRDWLSHHIDKVDRHYLPAATERSIQ